jgi:hypothetical protein
MKLAGAMSTATPTRAFVRAFAGAGALACALAGLALPATAQAAPSGADVSKFVRASGQRLPAGPQRTASAVSARPLTPLLGKSLAARASAEQVLQLVAGPSGGTVADPNSAVATGPKQVLVVTAQKAQVYAKSTAKPSGAALTLRALFGVNNSIDISQAQAAYDVVGKRFVIAALADQSGDIGLVVRVSKGSSPTSWYPPERYLSSSTSDPNPNAVESLPRLGLSSDKVLLTMAATDSGDATMAARTLILDKAKLEGGGAPDGWIANNNATYGGQVPAVNATSWAPAYVAVPDFDPITSNDLTALVYTWKNPNSAPQSAKLVVYPTDPIAAPPTVPQPGGVAPDLVVGDGGLQSAVWRSNQLWVATTVACKNDPSLACVRVWGINTATSGLTDETLTASGIDRFGPSLAVDAAGVPHVGYSLVSPGSTGPGFAVAARKSTNTWSSQVVVVPPTTAYESASWTTAAGASLDPTAPYDVWFTGATASSTAAAPANWDMTLTRASLTLYATSLKASKSKVKKGAKVTFSAAVTRPTGGQAVSGVAVKLQAKPKGTKKWKNVASAVTPGSGKVKWSLKVAKTTDYRVLVPGVAHSVGLTWLKVVGKPLHVTAS